MSFFSRYNTLCLALFAIAHIAYSSTIFPSYKTAFPTSSTKFPTTAPSQKPTKAKVKVVATLSTTRSTTTTLASTRFTTSTHSIITQTKSIVLPPSSFTTPRPTVGYINMISRSPTPRVWKDIEDVRKPSKEDLNNSSVNTLAMYIVIFSSLVTCLLCCVIWRRLFSMKNEKAKKEKGYSVVDGTNKDEKVEVTIGSGTGSGGRPHHSPMVSLSAAAMVSTPEQKQDTVDSHGLSPINVVSERSNSINLDDHYAVFRQNQKPPLPKVSEQCLSNQRLQSIPKKAMHRICKFLELEDIYHMSVCCKVLANKCRKILGKRKEKRDKTHENVVNEDVEQRLRVFHWNNRDVDVVFGDTFGFKGMLQCGIDIDIDEVVLLLKEPMLESKNLRVCELGQYLEDEFKVSREKQILFELGNQQPKRWLGMNETISDLQKQSSNGDKARILLFDETNVLRLDDAMVHGTGTLLLVKSFNIRSQSMKVISFVLVTPQTSIAALDDFVRIHFSPNVCSTDEWTRFHRSVFIDRNGVATLLVQNLDTLPTQRLTDLKVQFGDVITWQVDVQAMVSQQSSTIEAQLNKQLAINTPFVTLNYPDFILNKKQ